MPPRRVFSRSSALPTPLSTTPEPGVAAAAVPSIAPTLWLVGSAAFGSCLCVLWFPFAPISEQLQSDSDSLFPFFFRPAHLRRFASAEARTAPTVDTPLPRSTPAAIAEARW
jgi:hypothetical protein